MTITREQVADLQPGDVVRIVEVSDDGSRYIHEGPVRADGGNALDFAGFWIRTNGGEAPDWVHELTVVSRAPRPLYVNHPRTEAVQGDVFQPERSQWPLWVAGHAQIAEHKSAESCRWISRASLPTFGLRLLVDGETGQVVP